MVTVDIEHVGGSSGDFIFKDAGTTT